MEKLLLTLEEAAERLSVGRSRIFELISSGRLRLQRLPRPHRQPGGRTDLATQTSRGLDEQAP